MRIGSAVERRLHRGPIGWIGVVRNEKITSLLASIKYFRIIILITTISNIAIRRELLLVASVKYYIQSMDILYAITSCTSIDPNLSDQKFI